MDWLASLFSGINWAGIFVPDTPIVEIFVRGTLTYLGLYILLRFLLKRESAGRGINDLLVVVLIADAAQNAMAGNYNSLPDGLFLVAVIAGWAYAIDWLGFRFPRLRNLIQPPPLPLVQNGKILPRNMRSELITAEELMAELRLQGMDDLSRVRRAYIEADGQISFVMKDEEHSRGPEKRSGL